MEKITWQESYSVGVKSFDAQHKKLFAILNDLQEKLSKDSDPDLESVIFDLKAYVKFHFGEEEKYFTRFGYKNKESHIEQHRAYAEKINDLHARLLREDRAAAGELIAFVTDWIMNHIKIVDKEYSEFFQKNGLT